MLAQQTKTWIHLVETALYSLTSARSLQQVLFWLYVAHTYYIKASATIILEQGGGHQTWSKLQ